MVRIPAGPLGESQVRPAERQRAPTQKTLNCSICFMPIFGVRKGYRMWTSKGGPLRTPTYSFLAACQVPCQFTFAPPSYRAISISFLCLQPATERVGRPSESQEALEGKKMLLAALVCVCYSLFYLVSYYEEWPAPQTQHKKTPSRP